MHSPRRAYEEAAGILGIACDPATGRPANLMGGIGILDLAQGLLPLGIASTVVLSEAFENAPAVTMPVPALRDCLRGRPAIVMVDDLPEDDGEKHALAWTGDRLFDCRGPQAEELRIDDIAILGAAVLTIPNMDRMAA